MAGTPQRRKTSRRNPQAELRETLRRRLAIAVARVGTTAAAASLVGINRTQFSRYLNGKSQPRPDLLYRLSRALDLPLEWFFDPREDDAMVLAEHQFGVSMREAVRGQRFVADPVALPDGFYLSWKRTFAASMPYEFLLGHLSSRNGVRHMKFSTRWWRQMTPAQMAMPSRDRFYRCVVMRSANGLFLFGLHGAENRAISIYLRETAANWDSQSGQQYSGFASSAVFGNMGRSALVPFFLTRYQPGPGQSILTLARRTGGYAENEVPRHVLDRLEGLNVPNVRVLA